MTLPRGRRSDRSCWRNPSRDRRPPCPRPPCRCARRAPRAARRWSRETACRRRSRCCASSRSQSTRRTDLVLPDQLAGRRVERLHGVHGVGEIHDAVVHERRRLIRAALVHRPHPREPQILDVVACDLSQRAVAPGLVVAAHHQPVAGRRIAQHLVGDGTEVLHLAGDGQATRTAGTPAPGAPGALGGVTRCTGCDMVH